MTIKDKLFLCISLLTLLFCPSPGISQEKSGTTREPNEDVVRVDTRVVFVDVSVKDAKTNAPVRDLSLKNFQVLDDGKPRTLTYFSREGDTRRPLSLLVIIDLWSTYGKKYLRDHTAMLRLAGAFKQLAPEDKVAVMTTWIVEGSEAGVPLPKVKMISDFTSDREQTIDALGKVPKLVSQQEKLLGDIARSAGRAKWEIDLAWSLSEISEKVGTLTAAQPNTQPVVVGLIDDIFALEKGERAEVAEINARAGITFYGLVYKKNFANKLLIGSINQIAVRPGGKNLHAADYLAEQTGGQVSSVGRPEDLTSGLEKVINDLASRYSLGFALEDDERDDGRMHRLEVKVEANDAPGQKRNLKTRFRQSYFVPEIEK